MLSPCYIVRMQTNDTQPPVILLACDLMLSSSLLGVCRQLSRTMITAASAEAAIDLIDEHPDATLAVDLNTPLELQAFADRLPDDIKSQAVVFGPHVHVEKLKLARAVGFGTVTSRGDFVSNAATLLQK